jgi:hypothetical protein
VHWRLHLLLGHVLLLLLLLWYVLLLLLLWQVLVEVLSRRMADSLRYRRAGRPRRSCTVLHIR